jgi:peptidyl-prolyl cis-trans isomerase C
MLLLPIAACAPMMGPSGPSSGAVTPQPAPSVSHAHDERDASTPQAVGSLEHAANVDCPVAFDHADAILARVGDVVITACDVALADRNDRREGLSVRTPREILRGLVDDAVLAAAARAQSLDRESAVEREVRGVLADALVQSETRRRMAASLPDEAAMRAYYDAHTAEFTSEERVHLREIVLASEAEARDVLREAANTPFETLVTRSRSPDASRDQGDLGLVPRGGNDRVAASIASAGFALGEPQSWAPEPIRVERNVPVGRHGRTRREITWDVVQYLGTVPARTLSFDEARDAIRHRMIFGRMQAERASVRNELVSRARSSADVHIETRAIQRVHLRRDPPLRDEPRRHRR